MLSAIILSTKNPATLVVGGSDVTHYPFNECAKLIVLSKIKKIYYIYDKYPDSKETIASKNIFKKLNMNIEKYK